MDCMVCCVLMSSLFFQCLIVVFDWVIMERQRFGLAVPLIEIVSVDLSSKLKSSRWIMYLEGWRSLEHWLASCWFGCSENLFMFGF